MPLRLYLPSRVSYLGATVAAAGLGGVQLLERTPPGFALCSAMYVLVSATAFNIADGLTTLAGAFVFSFSVLTCLLGLVVKATLGQPGSSNLHNGPETMQIELIGMMGVFLAVCIEKRLRPARPILPTYLPLPNVRPAFYACAVLGVVSVVYYASLPTPAAGSFGSVLHRLNYCSTLAILLGTIDTVRRSNGRRCLSPLTATLLLFLFLEAFIEFQKEAFFLPVAAWLVALFYTRYRLKVADIVLLVCVAAVFVEVVIPYSQWARNQRVTGGAQIDNLPTALFLLQDFDIVRSGYQEALENEQSLTWDFYAPKHLGLLERLTMLPPDDSLVKLTDEQGYSGFEPLKNGLLSQIPTVLWPEKHWVNYGNEWGKQIGVLATADDSTGISFGATADAYHEGGLFGVLVIEPLVITCLLLVMSFGLGNVQDHPIALMMGLVLLHATPEVSLYGFPAIGLDVVFFLIFGFLLSYVFPLLGNVLEAPGKRSMTAPSAGV